MKTSETTKFKKFEESTFKKYIKKAQDEVATWPKWKHEHILLGFSEYQRTQEEKSKNKKF